MGGAVCRHVSPQMRSGHPDTPGIASMQPMWHGGWLEPSDQGSTARFPAPPAVSPPLPSADLTRPEPSALPSPPTNFGFYGHYKVLCTAFQRKGRRWPDLITLRHCFEIQHILMFSWAIFLNSYLPQVFLLFKILLLMQIKKNVVNLRFNSL